MTWSGLSGLVLTSRVKPWAGWSGSAKRDRLCGELSRKTKLPWSSSLFFSSDPLEQGLFDGAVEKLDMALDERIKRLKALAQKMPVSISRYTSLMKDAASPDLISRKQGLYDNLEQAEAAFESFRSFSGDEALQNTFLSSIRSEIEQRSTPYVDTIQGLAEIIFARK